MTEQPYRGLGEWYAAQRRAAEAAEAEAEADDNDDTDKES